MWEPQLFYIFLPPLWSSLNSWRWVNRENTKDCTSSDTYLDVGEPKVILMKCCYIDAAQQAKTNRNWPTDWCPDYGPPWPIACNNRNMSLSWCKKSTQTQKTPICHNLKMFCTEDTLMGSQKENCGLSRSRISLSDFMSESIRNLQANTLEGRIK